MEVITLIQGDEFSSLTPLFLIHPISGISLPFLKLDPICQYDERPVYGITSPLHCPGGDTFRFPPSMKSLASFYLQGVRRIQPEGPYLLGGWSMGGVIAMFMAQILEAAGEEVYKVIMIDSANPESLPSFSTSDELLQLAEATFRRTVSAGELQLASVDFEPESPESSPYEDDSNGNGEDIEDYLAARGRRASTWGSAVSSNASIISTPPSIFDQETPLATPGTPMTPFFDSEEFPFKEIDPSCDVESDADLLEGLLRRIKLHIYRGMELLASVQPGDLFPPGTRSNFDVILIKCAPVTVDFGRRYADHEGVRLIQTVMTEENMRWNTQQFKSFRSIPFSGDHDAAFQPKFVGELSDILRECIDDLD